MRQLWKLRDGVVPRGDFSEEVVEERRLKSLENF